VSPTLPRVDVTSGPARRRRDRHGRGPRGPVLPATAQLAGRTVRLPAHRTRSEQFDDAVLDAVEHLEERWSAQLADVEFAVEEVPAVPLGVDPALDADVVSDDTAGGAVPLGRLLPAGDDGHGGRTPPRVVVYRQPLQARAADRLDLADLVRDVVVDQVARLLGVDPSEVDPEHG
jgi:predicted Zn-dependent protease with MMP-like domain